MSVGETGVTNVERETALAPVDASGVCSKVAEWGLLSLLVLLPLVFTTDFTVNLFDLPKVTALRVVTVVILAALAIRAVLNGRLNLRRTRLDYPVLIFFGVAIVALFHTVSFPVSLMGEYGREDGFITLANYLVLFYFVVNLLTSRQLVKTALILQALTGFAVSIMALLESFAITPFPFAPGSFFDNRVFASLGNPDFLGTYMVMVIPISLGLMLESYGSKQRAVWGAISVVAVSALFLTYTRGAWIAAVASILVFLLVWRQIWKYKFSVLGIVLAVIVVLVILDLPVVSSWQASLLMNQRAQRENSHLAVQTSTGPVQSNRGQGNSTTSSAPVEQPSATQRAASGLNLESGTVAIRLQIWRSALPLVVENPLIGTGLNSFQSVFTKHASPEYAAGEGKTRFPDRAHNEYLHLAVTTGLLGLGAYLSILAVFGWRLLAWFRSHKGYRSRILLVAILASWTAYLVSNFFLFPVVGTGFQFWFLMGLGIALCGGREENKPIAFRLPPGKGFRCVAPAVILLISGYLVFLSLKPFIADHYLAEAQIRVNDHRIRDSREYFEKAIAWNSLSSTAHEYYGAALNMQAEVTQDPGARRLLLDDAVRQLTESIQIEPGSAGLYYLRGENYYDYQGDHVVDAYTDFKKAVELYPFFYYANGGLANAARQLNHPEEAIMAELAMLQVFPDDHQALYGLAQDYAAMGRYSEAETTLKKIGAQDPKNASVPFLLGRVYEIQGETEQAIGKYREAISLDPTLEQAKQILGDLEQAQKK